MHWRYHSLALSHWYKYHYIEVITLVLRCQRRRWYGHVQQAMSCTVSNLSQTFAIPSTRKHRRPNFGVPNTCNNETCLTIYAVRKKCWVDFLFYLFSGYSAKQVFYYFFCKFCQVFTHLDSDGLAVCLSPVAGPHSPTHHHFCVFVVFFYFSCFCAPCCSFLWWTCVVL